MTQTQNPIELISSYLRDVPDFPKPGIVFKDITPVLQNPKIFKLLIDQMTQPYMDQKIDYVVGIESRGFILGTPMAYLLNAGFIPIRKVGKLPADTLKKDYALEYGTATIEIHKDALKPGDRVLVVDDLLATGGTASAALDMLNELKADIVACTFAIELSFLNGLEKIAPCKTHSLIHF